MSGIFVDYMNDIYVVYGAAFIILGATIYLQPREGVVLRFTPFLHYLQIFGFAHGGLEWLDVWQLNHGVNTLFILATHGLRFCSFLALLEFGLHFLTLVRHQEPECLTSRWSYHAKVRLFCLLGVVFYCLTLPSSNLSISFNNGCRIFLGFTGALLAAYGFFFEARYNSKYYTPKILPNLYILSGSFFLYGLFGGLFMETEINLWPFNKQVFLIWVGIQIELVRATCAIIITISITQILRDANYQTQQQLILRNKELADSLIEVSKINQFNHQIIESAQEGIIVYDTQGRYLVWNPFMESITGVTKETCLGKYPADIFPFLKHTSVLAGLKRTLQGERVYNPPFRCNIPNNNDLVWASSTQTPLIINNQLIGVIETVSDITQCKAAEESMRQAKEIAETALKQIMLTEQKIITINEKTLALVGQELHDNLGQHLTGIAFLSEVLAKKLTDKHLPEMQDAINITAYINEAISQTRQLAQGLFPLQLQESGLKIMLEQLASSIRSIYHIQCELLYEDGFQIDDDLININLFRIAQEAVNNAIKHGKATQITLKTSVSADINIIKMLAISDNGIGIDAAPKTGESSSLGMLTMRYRATLIGGSLTIDSSSEGGTCITVSFYSP